MKQPDILFIVLDTQRADRLSAYGYERPTPNFDRFAQAGVLFEQAVSPAQWTVPSHASLFTGVYPTTHQVTQSYQKLDAERPHVAELMQEAGYETVSFCNNPLVGILDNGFQRGFDSFYNYGGAFPNRPESISPKQQLLGWGENLMRRYVAGPIQNFISRNDWAFQLSLNAWFTPLWSRMANFKGQNERSIEDLRQYLEMREGKEEKPLFLFLNLMETHLPFFPPQKYIDQVAPYFKESSEARGLMQRWNREAFRWAAPLAEPLPELEGRVLSDMYDAEVAYQDDYLGDLFACLEGRKNSKDTMTILVADHGDGLGEHDCIGHAFVAYQELLHVPLVVHWPKQLQGGRRIETAVSTRRVFHTILDAAGAGSNKKEIERLSLQSTIRGEDGEKGVAYAEVYPPTNFISVLEKRSPELIERFKCREIRRAVQQESLKLIQVGEEVDELFDLAVDPWEEKNLLGQREGEEVLVGYLEESRTAVSEGQSEGQSQDGGIEDEQLLEHLRNLGYIE